MYPITVDAAINTDRAFALLLAVWRRLQDAFERRAKTLGSKHEVRACRRHFEAAPVGFGKIEAEFIGMNEPFPDLLAAHRIASERPITLIDVTPVNLVCELHAGEFCTYLRAGQSLGIFRSRPSSSERHEGHETSGNPGVAYLAREAAHFDFSLDLQDFKHIWYSVLQAGPA